MTTGTSGRRSPIPGWPTSWWGRTSSRPRAAERHPPRRAGLCGDPVCGVSRAAGRARGRRPGLPLPAARLVGGDVAVSHASFWERLVRGTRWTWLAEPYRAALPADLESTVMGLESRDRLHAKQGRSTARVHFHTGEGPAGGLSEAALPAPLAVEAGGPGPSGRPSFAREGGMGESRTGPGARDRRARGRRRGRADRTVGRAAKLPDGRRAHRLPPLARGDPAPGGEARSRLVRPSETRADRARWPRSPRGCIGPGCSTRICTSAISTSTSTDRTGSMPAGADRPAPAGGTSPDGSLVALEGPGAAPLLDLRRGRDRRPRPIRFWAEYRRRLR